MKQLIDNFSTGSTEYATFRPESPKEIFDFLFSRLNNFNIAWDCGTGNGQVAATLADRFRVVYGTDISQEQLNVAAQKDNIIYLQERAEQTSLPDNSIDLITVAQAIHWFDFEKFYAEVRRVARPGALIAVWTYSLLRLTPVIDEVIDNLYMNITGPYWDKERAYVDEAYRTIPFPFTEVQAPEFGIKKQWNIAQVAGYLRTWSGVKHYLQKENRDPVSMIMDDLKKAWGSDEAREVKWPVHIRVGEVK
jgi:SAM-dependent methyltransferase